MLHSVTALSKPRIRESSAAKSHTPFFHRSPKKILTLSSYRVFRESSQEPAFKKNKTKQ